jgi:hypothetical protein
MSDGSKVMTIEREQKSDGILRAEIEVNEIRDGRVVVTMGDGDASYLSESLVRLFHRPEFRGRCFVKLPETGLDNSQRMVLLGSIASWCDFVALYDAGRGKYVVINRPRYDGAYGPPPDAGELQLGDLLDDIDFEVLPAWNAPYKPRQSI